MDSGAKAHAFVDAIDAPDLDDDDRHHLARVLRLRDGAVITVSDGHGRWRHCRFGASLEALDAVAFDERPAPELTVAFALVKANRPELVVQKLTELGVDRIVPFVAARSVVRWDDVQRRRNRERLATVARMAAMQSRRAWLPDVEPVATFDDVVRRPGVALADSAGEPPSLALPCVAVGPEGGWSDDERAAGVPLVRLAATVLRAETAAIAAGAVLGALRAGLTRTRDGHAE